MATYYISIVEDGNTVVYALNSTQNIQRNLSGELSEHRLESGQVSADNYLNKPDTFAMSGIISDVFVPGTLSKEERKSTKDYIEGLQRIKENAIPFTFHYASDLTPAYPCFFTSLQISQGGDTGSVGTNRSGQSVNSYNVNMSIKKVRVAQATSVETGRASEFVDPTKNKTEASSPTNTTDQDLIDAYIQAIEGTTKLQEGARRTELAGG